MPKKAKYKPRRRKLVIQHRISPLTTFFENNFYKMSTKGRTVAGLKPFGSWEFEDVDL